MRLAATILLIAQLPDALAAQGGQPPRDTAQKLPTAAVVAAPNPPPKP